MTLKIEVEIPYEVVREKDAANYLDQAMSTLGYARGAPVEWNVAVSRTPAVEIPPAQRVSATEAGSDSESANPQFRERNKAGEGRARRTKEEIAEDKELDGLVATHGMTDAEVDEALAQIGHKALIADLRRGTKMNPEPDRNISADPENRTNPEDEAQDKADEAAEVEAKRDAENPLTVDDLRKVMGQYVEAHGMEATQEDGPKIFQSALGAPPAGEDGWKVSLVAPQGQETLAKAVSAWQAALDSGKRFGEE